MLKKKKEYTNGCYFLYFFFYVYQAIELNKCIFVIFIKRLIVQVLLIHVYTRILKMDFIINNNKHARKIIFFYFHMYVYVYICA